MPVNPRRRKAVSAPSRLGPKHSKKPSEEAAGPASMHIEPPSELSQAAANLEILQISIEELEAARTHRTPLIPGSYCM